MRVIESRYSLLTFWQHLVFTEAALLAHPDTGALAAPFTKLLDDFSALHGRDLDTRRGILQAQARAVIGDQNVDEGLRKLHSDTLSEVLQDRGHAIFKALFESDIAATTRFALARQLEITKAVVGNLALSIVPASLKGHVARLQGLVDAGLAILDKKKQAAFARTEANLTTAAWKDDVNAVRLTTYGALLGIAAKARRPKTWVEAFFMQASDARDSVDTDTDTTPEGAASPTEVAPPVETPSA